MLVCSRMDTSPRLKVMVVEEGEGLKKRISKSTEGYSVLIEESGIIHLYGKWRRQRNHSL